MIPRWLIRCAVRAGLSALVAVCAVPAALAAVQSMTAPYPKLAVQTLDGKTFDLAAERGKWVIVNFWATWCGPCIAEMPAISKYVADHNDVTAIGLAWDRSPRDKVVAFAHAHRVDYPLAQVDTDVPPGDFEPPAGLPTSYLVAPDGRVVKYFIGPVTAAKLDAAIRAARASAPAHEET